MTAYPESDISKYSKYIKAAEKAASSEGCLNMLLSDISDGYFALIDINSDNIPEFFLMDSNRNIYGVYTLINDTAVELSAVGGRGRDGIALYNDGYITVTEVLIEPQVAEQLIMNIMAIKN